MTVQAILPSAAQGRLLRILRDYKENGANFDFKGGELRWQRFAELQSIPSKLRRHNGGEKFRFATYAALVRNGWVEERPDDGRDRYSTRQGYKTYVICERGLSALELMSDEDFISHIRNGGSDRTITEQIYAALAKRYRHDGFLRPPEWVYFQELGVAAHPHAQHMDAWAMNTWNSRAEARAFEVKASRRDFLNELKDPTKRESAMLLSDTFYFVTPSGVVRPEELPGGCGLIEWNGKRLRTVVKAPRRNVRSFPFWFVQSLARRVQALEMDNEEEREA